MRFVTSKMECFRALISWGRFRLTNVSVRMREMPVPQMVVLQMVVLQMVVLQMVVLQMVVLQMVVLQMVG